MSSTSQNCIDSLESFTIRRLQTENEKELSLIVSLVNRCYRTTDNWTTEASILDGLRLTRDSLLKEARLHDIFVVEEPHSKTLIGCVKTGIVTETVVGPLSEPTGYIGLLSVSGTFQSRGLGTKLMTFAEDHCRRLGVKKVSMDVLGIREDIIAWYERCGYKKTGHSIDSAPFFKRKGEVLLKPSSFVLFQKTLSSLDGENH